MNNTSIKVKNYKCFNEEPQGFDKILPINIIIGRNNSGKSSLIDLVNFMVTSNDLQKNALQDRTPEIIVKTRIDENSISNVFRADYSGGPIRINHFEYGRKWIDRPITYAIQKKSKRLISADPDFPEEVREYATKLVNNLPNKFSGLTFKQIKAERKISPETDRSIIVNSDGTGATNIIQNYINKANLPSELVENTLLEHLNKIFHPDSYFNDIVVQQLEDGNWEIFIEEDKKGRIALSQSGSGLQTILLVLINILLVPCYEKKKLKDYVFAFEELENNLHPSLQRRLLSYLREIAISEGALFFITTHSNVVIDLFSKDKNAQILHITHNSAESRVKTVTTYVEQRGILDDLDIRASDLLQANCIVWVEGPSDRLYFNHWVKLWSNASLIEGNHYQCVFYGGRLLSHLSADSSSEGFRRYIQILLVNKNAILIMDSDKRYKSDKINDTKLRIKEEMEKCSAYPWITKGKEIENYIPSNALEIYLNMENVRNVKQYENFPEYLENLQKGQGKKFLNNKILFAETIREFLTKESLTSTLDLDSEMKHVIKLIHEWNSSPVFG